MGQREARGRQHTIFVYGTLKKGLSNHFFLSGANYLGPARTVNRYALYVDMYPGVYPSDQISPIVGQLFEVDSATLSRLDALEDHPRLYRRELIEVDTDEGRRSAWIYFYPQKGGRLIPSGEFDPKKELGID